MKKTPILFSASMVRAILNNSKTQTRRIIKYPKMYKLNDLIKWEIRPHKDSPELFSFWYGTNYTMPAFKCPYGKPGDELWVKETFGISGNRLFYRADRDDFENAGLQGLYDFKWKPSIFMPNKLSRIDLEVTDVRVERLQDISEDDAVKEGIESSNEFQSNEGYLHQYKDYIVDDFELDAYTSYQTLWESINGQGSWNLNPWVWVVTFKDSEVSKN